MHQESRVAFVSTLGITGVDMDPIALVVSAVVIGMTNHRVEEQEITRFTCIIEQDFGQPYGHRRPKQGPVTKVILIEHNLMFLWRQQGIVTPVLLQDEASLETVTRFLRPGRRYEVNDPVIFNKSFRKLQSEHGDWPGRGNHKTTTSITQILDALGFQGEGVDSSPHAIRQGNIRGARDTDPRESSGARKRDILYYRAYVHNPERALKKENAKRLFHEPFETEDTRAAKRAKSAEQYRANKTSLHGSTTTALCRTQAAGPCALQDTDSASVHTATSLLPENGPHMDPPQNVLVHVNENHNNSSMPSPASDDTSADALQFLDVSVDSPQNDLVHVNENHNHSSMPSPASDDTFEDELSRLLQEHPGDAEDGNTTFFVGSPQLVEN